MDVITTKKFWWRHNVCHHNAVYTNDITMKQPLATIKLYYTILIVLDELLVAAKFLIFHSNTQIVVSLFFK